MFRKLLTAAFLSAAVSSRLRHQLRACPVASNVVHEKASGPPGLWELLLVARSAGSSAVWQASPTARPSKLNTFLTTLFDPGIFLRPVSARARRGACPCTPGG